MIDPTSAVIGPNFVVSRTGAVFVGNTYLFLPFRLTVPHWHCHKPVSLLHLFLPKMQHQLPHLFSFRLTVYPSPQFMQFYGRILSRLPCLTSRSKKLDSAWPLRSIRITRLHHCYEPLRHPLAFGPFPVFSYRAYLSPRISPQGKQDFSSFHRVPVTVPPPLPRQQ